MTQRGLQVTAPLLVLGEVGQGFAPMQKRLTVRRLEMGAMGVGMASRALEMMCQHVTQRETFSGPRVGEFLVADEVQFVPLNETREIAD